MSINDLLASGAPSFKFKEVGDTVKGVLTAAEKQNATDINGNPKYYDSGEPMKQLVITLRQDDGEEVRVFCKWEAEKAIRTARDEVGADFELGGRLALKYTGDREATKKGHSPTMLFTAQYAAPVNNVSANDLL